MSALTKRILAIVAGLVIAAVIIGGYLAGRTERAKEAAREAPISAPSRMRETDGPLGSEAAVVLDSAAEARAGIVTSVLRSGASVGSVQLSGVLVADPSRITTIQASVPGRLMALGGHWPVLGEHVAPGTLLAQVSDARPLSAPRGGAVTRVSAQPGELVQAGQELLQLTDFSLLIARIAWSPEAPRIAPSTITITPLESSPGAVASRTATARLVGPAANVDSLTRLPVYLYRTRAAWPGARPGASVRAVIGSPTAGVAGVFVPTEAVVQWEGLAWAYVRRAAGGSGEQFVRRRVDVSHPVPGGWRVTTTGALSVHAGDIVAVRGAQELLSEEFRSRASVGDEQDQH